MYIYTFFTEKLLERGIYLVHQVQISCTTSQQLRVFSSNASKHCMGQIRFQSAPNTEAAKCWDVWEKEEKDSSLTPELMDCRKMKLSGSRKLSFWRKIHCEKDTKITKSTGVFQTNVALSLSLCVQEREDSKKVKERETHVVGVSHLNNIHHEAQTWCHSENSVSWINQHSGHSSCQTTKQTGLKRDTGVSGKGVKNFLHLMTQWKLITKAHAVKPA